MSVYDYTYTDENIGGYPFIVHILMRIYFEK